MLPATKAPSSAHIRRERVGRVGTLGAQSIRVATRGRSATHGPPRRTRLGREYRCGGDPAVALEKREPAPVRAGARPRGDERHLRHDPVARLSEAGGVRPLASVWRVRGYGDRPFEAFSRMTLAPRCRSEEPSTSLRPKRLLRRPRPHPGSRSGGRRAGLCRRLSGRSGRSGSSVSGSICASAPSIYPQAHEQTQIALSPTSRWFQGRPSLFLRGRGIRSTTSLMSGSTRSSAQSLSTQTLRLASRCTSPWRTRRLEAPLREMNSPSHRQAASQIVPPDPRGRAGHENGLAYSDCPKRRSDKRGGCLATQARRARATRAPPRALHGACCGATPSRSAPSSEVRRLKLHLHARARRSQALRAN